MKVFHLVLAATVAAGVAAPLHAQMSSMTQMGGGSYSTSLISPVNADTQIGRGMVMITQAMPGMRGMPMMTPGSGANTRGLRVRLTLTGVTQQNALLTRSGNHLYVVGSLTPGDGSSPQTISVDQEFDITNGSAILYVPLTLSSFTLPATLQIDHVEVADAEPEPKVFGVPGLRMSAAPTPHMTPGMGGGNRTPGMGMGGSAMTSNMGPRAIMTSGAGPRATMTPGTGASTMMPSSMGSQAHMTPGMSGITMTPGMKPAATKTPGMGGSTMPSGMGSHTTHKPGLGGSSMTSGMGSHATMTPRMGGATMTPGTGPHATMTPGPGGR